MFLTIDLATMTASDTEDLERFLAPSEAGLLIGVTAQQVRNYFRSGQIPTTLAGKRLVARARDVVAFRDARDQARAERQSRLAATNQPRKIP